MAENAFIHIGLAKTGTTAIQTVLATARRDLADRGLLFPYAGTVNNKGGHHCLAWALGGNAHLSALCEGDPLGELSKEIREAVQETVIVSAEDLSGISYKATAIQTLLAALGATEVRVVVYVREQVEWFNSFYVEVLKDLAETRSVGEFTASLLREPRYHYSNWLSLWRELSAGLIVRPFVRKSLINGDVVDDFLSTIGVEPEARPKTPPLEPNRTLSASRAAALLYIARKLRASNRSPETMGRERWIAQKRELLPVILNMSALDGPAHWGFGKQMATDIRATYRDSNRDFLGRNGLEPTLFEDTESRSVQTVSIRDLNAAVKRELDDRLGILE
jgi:hypothetical protein